MWVAVHEEVVDGRVVQTPFTIHWVGLRAGEPTNATMPVTRFPLSPPDGSTIEGWSILFEWDARDFQTGPSLSRLMVKERLIGQSAEDAMSVNDVRFETVIENVRFFVLKVTDLKDLSANHVWQVTALNKTEGGGLTPAVAGEIRTFRLANGHVDLDWLMLESDEAAAPAGQVEQVGHVLPVSVACPNGDLEDGTLAGWQAFSGSRLYSPGIDISSLTPRVVNGQHTITSLADGDDPFLPGILKQVGEGSFAVRLGDTTLHGKVDALAYTFVVNEQNKNFSFMYALVLQNPLDHTPDQQPFFIYYVVRGSSILLSFYNLPVVAQQIVADSINPFFKTQGPVVYREWTSTCLDLSAYLNQTMTIVFATADCSLGGHFGYAYIDGLCKNNGAVASFTMPSEICAGADLWVDGSASANETSSFWSIEESDANGIRKPNTEVYEWFVAQHAANKNLTAFYASKGGRFKCNTYYRIKLAVSNDCTPWNENVQILHVVCPTVTAGPDVCVSCRPNGLRTQLGVGNPADPGLTYTWDPVAGLDNPSSPSPFHTQGSLPYPMTYTVKVTDARNGCSSSDQVTLYCEPPAVDLVMVPDCCRVTLIATVTGGYQTIVWAKDDQPGQPPQTFQPGELSIIVTSPGTYSVIVQNRCGHAVESVVVPATGLTGFFNPIAANSIFSPPSGAANLADKLYIKDVIVGNGAQGVPNAYNATGYQLDIYDRWGQLVKSIPGHQCQGFTNWSIAWDGTDQSGNLVPQGTYVWKLGLSNCQYTDLTAPKMRRFEPPNCDQWFTIFDVKLWCTHERPGGIIDVPFIPQGVTVIR